jgi:putative ABC transport system permease protein
MKWLPLVWASLFHRRARTLFTLLSVLTAFLLFGLLDGVRIAFNPVSSEAGNLRMFTVARFSVHGLPQSLARRFQNVSGVRQVTWASFLGGHFQDPRNTFATYAVDRHFFNLYPDYALADDQRRAFEDTRTGAIAGEALARRFNWKVGDRIPLLGTLRTNKDTGTNEWTFDLVGTFKVRTDKIQSDENSLLVHWDALDTGSIASTHEVGMIISQIDPTARHDAVAQDIDAMSANSDHETTTMTEQALNQSYFRQFGDIGLMMSAIVTAVFFTLLLITGTITAQGVRERTPQLATLKALGFVGPSVLGIVLSESLLMMALGGAVGLAFATLAVRWISRMGSPVPISTLGLPTWLTGALIMLASGLLVGALPAWRAMKLKIVDALAEV